MLIEGAPAFRGIPGSNPGIQGLGNFQTASVPIVSTATQQSVVRDRTRTTQPSRVFQQLYPGFARRQTKKRATAMVRPSEDFVRSHRNAPNRGEVWPCPPSGNGGFNCSARCILAHYDYPPTQDSGKTALSWANEPAGNLLHSQFGEDLLLLPTLMGAAGRRPGRFVELGAFNGLSMSNTLLLERCLGWRGLLIEAQPTNFAALNQSGRSAAMVHASTACGRDSAVVARVTLRAGPTAGQVESMARSFLKQHYSHGVQDGTVEVPCD